MATRYMINLTVTLPERYEDSSDLEKLICDTLFGALGADSVVDVDIVDSDYIKNIENITGGAGADTIKGDQFNNILKGVS